MCQAWRHLHFVRTKPLTPTRRAPEGPFCTPMTPPTQARPPSARTRKPDFQEIMRQAHHTPFAANLLEASQRKATETPPFFALTKHRFHDDLAPGVQRTTWLTAHLSRHALLGCAWRLRRLWRRAMVRHTTGRHGGIKTHLLQRLGGGLTVIPIVQRRHDRLRLTPGIRWPRNTGLLKHRKRRLCHGGCLLRVVRF